MPCSTAQIATSHIIARMNVVSLLISMAGLKILLQVAKAVQLSEEEEPPYENGEER